MDRKEYNNCEYSGGIMRTSLLTAVSTRFLNAIIVFFICGSLLTNAFVLHDSNIAVGRHMNELIYSGHKGTCRAVATSSLSLSGSASDSTISSKPLSSASTRKEELLRVLGEVPTNAPSSRTLTRKILAATRELEEFCPTVDDSVLDELGGNWELIWTAQDRSSPEGAQTSFTNWINNNPNGSLQQSLGRASPILPRNIQDKLEEIGLLSPSSGNVRGDNNDESSDTDRPPAKSNQIIDLKKSRVRNIVTFEAAAPPLLPPFSFLISKTRSDSGNRSVRGSLTVDVKFTSNKVDLRKVDVKFESCRLVLQQRPLPLDITFPLGPIGPTGWLRTGYIDDTIRITRGHKGSVFILSRAAKKSSMRN